MDYEKITNDLTFKVVYADGDIKDVEEGILFEFNGNAITFHLGTNRKACLFSVADALTEVIADMGLGKEFKQYIHESDFLDELSGLN